MEGEDRRGWNEGEHWKGKQGEDEREGLE